MSDLQSTCHNVEVLLIASVVSAMLIVPILVIAAKQANNEDSNDGNN